MYTRVSRMAAYPKEDLPYTRLDAAQLVKHYLGLKVSYPQQTRVLVYLYWEPTNAGGMDAYKRHRLEVEDFARRVARLRHDVRFDVLPGSLARVGDHFDLARHARAPGPPARPLPLRDLTHHLPLRKQLEQRLARISLA